MNGVNGKVVLLVIGLVVGAVVGYLTRPESAEITVGPLSIQVQSDRPAQGGGPMTSAQWQHVMIFTALGGVIGAAVGFVVDRRRV
jgi:hypothetical protein